MQATHRIQARKRSSNTSDLEELENLSLFESVRCCNNLPGALSSYTVPGAAQLMTVAAAAACA